MPNWVYNTMTVSGLDRDTLEAFAKQAARPYNAKYMKHVVTGSEWDWVMVDEVNEGPLLFWNFIKPDDSILEEYWGPQPKFDSLADSMASRTNHWYDWNCRNWGTKWDACDPEVGDIERQADNYYSLDYEFRTAWADPKEVFEAMVQQYPTLNFSVTCNEEQGWGVEYWGENGELTVTDQWDIPSTHEEQESRTGNCYCEINDDYRPFDDCPVKKETVNA
jgi:hypothetical protein